MSDPSFLTKLKWSLPWLSRYPFWRMGEFMRRITETNGTQHLIIMVANHFEPSWNEDGSFADLETQKRRLEMWCNLARATGNVLRDHDGIPFRHTNFYPGEQYHRSLLEMLAGLEADGFGEVEIHLHHGLEEPDTAENLRATIEEFRDLLAEEHQCLSREEGNNQPRYAFVHGNLALANSMGGRYCGVDNEMQILADTGCYADLTLPAAPGESQVSMINAIYQCGHPLTERAPHRNGDKLHVGVCPVLPIIITGPLVFDWGRRRYGFPFPRLDDGVLTASYPSDASRLEHWRDARVAVRGRSDWLFIKLYCHGFFSNDMQVTIGEPVRRFWSEVMDKTERNGQVKIHFITAREAFNIAMAAVDGHSGNPSLYRDYRLRPIRNYSFNTKGQRIKGSKVWSGCRSLIL